MKTFIVITKETKKGKQFYEVYRVKNNKPYYLGRYYYQIGANKGLTSEVFNYLIEGKYIPKNYYKLSKNDWRDAGYYCGAVENKGIRIIAL